MIWILPLVVGVVTLLFQQFVSTILGNLSKIVILSKRSF